MTTVPITTNVELPPVRQTFWIYYKRQRMEWEEKDPLAIFENRQPVDMTEDHAGRLWCMTHGFDELRYFAVLQTAVSRVGRWKMKKGDDYIVSDEESDYMTYGIHVGDWGNQIEVRGSEELRDAILAQASWFRKL